MLEYNKMYLIVAKRKSKKEFLEYYVGFVINETEVEYGFMLYEDQKKVYFSKDDLDLYDIFEIEEMNSFVVSFNELIAKYNTAYETFSNTKLTNILSERTIP